MPNQPPANEVECPYCWGRGEVHDHKGQRKCPICEGYRTVPEEIAQRILEVAARELPGGEAG